MLRALATVILFPLAAAACASAPEPADCAVDGVQVLAVPANWSSNRFDAAATAASNWNAIAGREVIRLERGERDSCAIHQVAEGLAHDAAGHSFVGWTDGEAALVTVAATYSCEPGAARGTDPDCFRHIIEHELGHILLGPEHVTRGVMQPVDAAASFSDEDLAHCREAGVCR